MKKTIILILSISLLLSSVIFPVHAADVPDAEYILETADGTKVIQLKDGGKITLTTTDYVDDSIVTRAATANTTGKSREVKYTNNSGDVEWVYTLSAVFSYTPGVSSTCTNATYSEEIYDSSWHFSDGAATRSGNTAYGVGTFKHKVLFITTATYNIDISLTCDTYGNVN